MMSINVNQLGAKARSKHEMYRILTSKLRSTCRYRRNARFTLLETSFKE